MGAIVSRREPRVIEEEEDYLGPVAIAVFIDIGFIKQWPKTWSKAGLNGIRNGYGRWEGSWSHLPYGTDRIEGGTAHWPGRRAAFPGS